MFRPIHNHSCSRTRLVSCVVACCVVAMTGVRVEAQAPPTPIERMRNDPRALKLISQDQWNMDLQSMQSKQSHFQHLENRPSTRESYTIDYEREHI